MPNNGLTSQIEGSLNAHEIQDPILVIEAIESNLDTFEAMRITRVLMHQLIGQARETLRKLEPKINTATGVLRQIRQDQNRLFDPDAVIRPARFGGMIERLSEVYHLVGISENTQDAKRLIASQLLEGLKSLPV